MGTVMKPFNQSFAKISVAKFFDAVGYLKRETGMTPRIKECPLEDPMREEHGCSVVSVNEVEREGTAVLKEVVRMTGLPEDYLDSVLSGLLGTEGSSVNDLSLDQLRTLLVNCLESMNEQMSEIDSNPIN